MDESIFVKVQESRETPAQYWNKTNLTLEALKRVRRKFYFTCVTPPPRQHSSVSRQTFLPCDFSHGESERMCEWVPSFLSYIGCFQTQLLLSYPNQNTKVFAQLWDREQLGKQQSGLLEGIKET